MANSDRPDNKPNAKPTDQVDLWENGDDRTPVEGCSPRSRATPSTPPDQTSAKGALSDADTEDIFSPESWDPDPPDAESPGPLSCTPAPVVIGVDAALRPSQVPELGQSQQRPVEDWKDPGAKNTPPEPVASRRVRQRANEKTTKRRSPSQRARGSANVCDDRIVTVTELQPSALYFPPMKPPESIPGHVATRPKVQVVPECDTRLKTARSLRRRSSMPPSIHRGLRLTYGWPLYLMVAGLACAMAIGLVRGLTLIMPTRSSSARTEPTPTTTLPLNPTPFGTSQSRSDSRLADAGAPSVARRPSTLQGSSQPRKGEQPPTTESSSPRSMVPTAGGAATESATDATVF